MISYRDRTFCPFYKSCMHGGDCDAALTDKVSQDAEEFGLPTCQYTEWPSCHELREEE